MSSSQLTNSYFSEGVAQPPTSNGMDREDVEVRTDRMDNSVYIFKSNIGIGQCVKTLYPCSSHQNSWDLWMFIPLKMVLIGIDP